MFKKLLLVLLILGGIFILSGGCNGEKPAAENEFADDPLEEEDHEPAAGGHEQDFLIMTAYDCAPIGCEYGTVGDRQMDTEQMLAELDKLSGFIFFKHEVTASFLYGDREVEGQYVEFHFLNKEEPQNIEVYYIAGDAVEQKYQVDDYPIKVPEEPGVYNFFAELSWKSGYKETVFFRVTVTEDNPSSSAPPCPVEALLS